MVRELHSAVTLVIVFTMAKVVRQTHERQDTIGHYNNSITTIVSKRLKKNYITLEITNIYSQLLLLFVCKYFIFGIDYFLMVLSLLVLEIIWASIMKI